MGRTSTSHHRRPLHFLLLKSPTQLLEQSLILFIFLLMLQTYQQYANAFAMHVLVALLPPFVSINGYTRSRLLSSSVSISRLHCQASAAAGVDDDNVDDADQQYASWKHYAQYSQLRKQYEQAGGILYRQSVLTQEEYDFIRQELDTLIGKGGTLQVADETTPSVASNRMGARLHPENSIVAILGNSHGSIARLVNEVEGGDDLKLSTDVPVEVRIYEKTGAGMEWHVDDMLYDPEQVEVVLTIENNSDCVTMWEEDVSGGITKRIEVETSANSAILIKAGGARHRVSPLRNGRRVILKFVYIKAGSCFVDGAEKHINQFSASASKKRKKKR